MKKNNQQEYFNNNIPIIDQLKKELGEKKVNDLFQEKQNVFDDNFEVPLHKEKFKINKEKGFNKDALEKEVFIEKSNDKKVDIVDENMEKLFPKAKKISELYDTFDEYEENLEIIDFMKNNIDEKNSEGQSENNEEVKLVDEEENIYIHEYE